MANYTITTTDEQETALTLMAAGKQTNQQLLSTIVTDALTAIVNQRKQTDLAVLEEQSLETLEALTAQNTVS